MLYPEARKDAKNSAGEEPPTVTHMVRSALEKAVKAWQMKNAKAYKKLKDAVGLMGWDNLLIRSQVRFTLVLIVLGTALSSIAPLALKYFIDYGQNALRNESFTTASVLIALYFTAQILERVVVESRQRKILNLQQLITQQIRKRAVDHLIRLPLQEHLKSSAGHLYSYVEQAVRGAHSLTQNTMVGLFPEIFHFTLILIIIGAVLNWELVALIFLILAAYAWIFYRYYAHVVASQQKAHEASTQYTTLATDVLQQPENIKISSSEQYWISRLHGTIDKAQESWEVIRKDQIQHQFRMQLTFGMGTALIMTLALWQYRLGLIGVGDMVLLLIYLTQLLRPIEMFGTTLERTIKSLGSMDMLVAALQVEPEPPPSNQLFKFLRVQIEEQGAIECHNVCFSYSGENLVLDRISISIPEGVKIAILGPNGSGKSTLARLLARLYLPSSGRILIMGKDITEWNPAELRKQIGFVGQETALFYGTVLDNIALGKIQNEQNTLDRILFISGVHDMVEKMVSGLETQVGPRGTKLSGGQRQRVAIARALMACPRVLIFDEATSALDVISEKSIIERIDGAYGSITRIYISHRMAPIINADIIFIIDQGRIIDHGTHCDLLNHSVRYQAILEANK